MKNLKTILTFWIGSISILSQAQYYIARDLTAENSFSENIEGPNVDRHGNLLVVNYINDGTIGLVKPNGKASLFATLQNASIANSIMLDKQGNLLLADWVGHSILKVNKQSKAITTYCHSDQFNQPNDLCITRNGTLYASDPNWKEGTGKLWKIDTLGNEFLLESDLGTTNGIELSPSERILYVNESVQRNVWAYDVNRAGDISNKRLLIKFEDFGLDGMKCDLEGNLYIARHGKGVIAIVTPEGELVREISLKGKNVSNLTFGGKDGRTCYATLQDRKCIETFRTEIPGKRWK